MLNCKEVVRILGCDENLSFSKKIQLRMHLWMCKHCGAYAHQMKAIKEGFTKMFLEKTAIDKQVLTQVKTDVLSVINKAYKQTLK